MSKITQRTRTEKLLLEAARIFNSTLEYEDLLESVLKLVMTAAGSEAALVFRVDHHRSDMKIRFMLCAECDMKVIKRELNEEVTHWASRFREPFIVNNASDNGFVDPELSALVGIKIRTVLTVPLIGKGHMIGVIQALNKADGEFTDADQDMLTGLNNQIAVAIDNAHLYREVKREALEKNLLLEVGMKLSSSLNLDEVLRAIMSSLKQVISYDVGGVFLIDPEEMKVKSIFVVGYDPSYDEKLQLKIGQGLIGSVAHTGEPVNVPDVSKDSRYVDANPKTKSELVVPIKLGDKILGVINLESDQLRAYDRRTISLVSAFASQAAISLERARLHQSLLDAKKLDEQLNIAREIQRSFLPERDPAVAGYDVCGTNISSGQVGGDYYDFIRIVDGHTGIAIGDVSGKGMPAALIMASFRASLIAEIRNNYSIRTICQKVNSLLFESMESGNYVTAVYGVLDARHHILTFSNCGHNLPVLLRKNGQVEYLAEGGPVLGVTSDATYEERAMVLSPGDTVVLYTDGVTEVFDKNGVEFGLDRLIEVIKKNKAKSAKEIQAAIYAVVTKFASEDHIYDDLTMIVIKRLPV
ncbi:MAG: SpoIIE family protein phosphatase [candidate division Zixibacteria bacterium]|nr:SpoIIE family protein phosphatase [candidate division Zixibacteria bacterium]